MVMQITVNYQNVSFTTALPLTVFIPCSMHYLYEWKSWIELQQANPLELQLKYWPLLVMIIPGKQSPQCWGDSLQSVAVRSQNESYQVLYGVWNPEDKFEVEFNINDVREGYYAQLHIAVFCSLLPLLRLSKVLENFLISEERRLTVARKYLLLWRRDEHLVPSNLAGLRLGISQDLWASCRTEKDKLLVQSRELKSYFQFDVRKKADDLNVIPC